MVILEPYGARHRSKYTNATTITGVKCSNKNVLERTATGTMATASTGGSWGGGGPEWRNKAGRLRGIKMHHVVLPLAFVRSNTYYVPGIRYVPPPQFEVLHASQVNLRTEALHFSKSTFDI